MKRRLTHAALWYLAAVIVLGGIKPALDWLDHRARQNELSAPIYAPVTAIEVSREPWRIVVRGVSRKLLDCSVVNGGHVLLVAEWTDNGVKVQKAYPPVKDDGAEVFGAPLVVPGGSFVVGPWRIEDDAATLDRIETLAVRLPCQFPSGVTRVATIGPMEISE